MGKNSPESTSSTTQTSKDQKQTAGDYSIQVAENAKIADSVKFEGLSETELDVFNAVAKLASDAFKGSQQAFQDSLQQVTQRYENQESDLTKVFPVLYVIAGVVAVYFLSKSKMRWS